jgi:hypothetical protein
MGAGESRQVFRLNSASNVARNDGIGGPGMPPRLAPFDFYSPRLSMPSTWKPGQEYFAAYLDGLLLLKYMESLAYYTVLEQYAVDFRVDIPDVSLRLGSTYALDSCFVFDQFSAPGQNAIGRIGSPYDAATDYRTDMVEDLSRWITALEGQLGVFEKDINPAHLRAHSDDTATLIQRTYVELRVMNIEYAIFMLRALGSGVKNLFKVDFPMALSESISELQARNTLLREAADDSLIGSEAGLFDSASDALDDLFQFVLVQARATVIKYRARVDEAAAAWTASIAETRRAVESLERSYDSDVPNGDISMEHWAELVIKRFYEQKERVIAKAKMFLILKKKTNQLADDQQRAQERADDLIARFSDLRAAIPNTSARLRSLRRLVAPQAFGMNSATLILRRTRADGRAATRLLTSVDCGLVDAPTIVILSSAYYKAVADDLLLEVSDLNNGHAPAENVLRYNAFMEMLRQYAADGINYSHLILANLKALVWEIAFPQ